MRKETSAVVSRRLLRSCPAPHHSSPKAQRRPRVWLRRWSLARLLVQRQEGQLREGGFQPKHSTVQVNAALPWDPGVWSPPCQLTPAPLPSASPCSHAPAPSGREPILLILLLGLIKQVPSFTPLHLPRQPTWGLHLEPSTSPRILGQAQAWVPYLKGKQSLQSQAKFRAVHICRNRWKMRLHL